MVFSFFRPLRKRFLEEDFKQEDNIWTSATNACKKVTWTVRQKGEGWFLIQLIGWSKGKAVKQVKRVKESTKSHLHIIFISLSRDKKLCWGACAEPSETVHYVFFVACKALQCDLCRRCWSAWCCVWVFGGSWQRKNIKEGGGSKPRSSFCFGSATNIWPNLCTKFMCSAGWQDLAGFRRGQKWPWNLSSSAYLQFSRQMRRFCA